MLIRLGLEALVISIAVGVAAKYDDLSGLGPFIAISTLGQALPLISAAYDIAVLPKNGLLAKGSSILTPLILAVNDSKTYGLQLNLRF
jgi:hypothetical protein